MPASPRRPLIPRSPLLFALTLLAFGWTPRPAEAQGLNIAPGFPLETGLVQRVLVGSNFANAFAGSLLPSGWDREQWTPFSFPYGLTAPSRGDSAGTEATLFGGERALAGGRFRHAARVGGGSLFEASSHYLRGTDWPFADPVEERLRERSAFLLPRDDQLERWGGEIRYDLRPGDADGWVFEAGLDRLRGNQLTELGAAHAQGWTRWHGQARYRRGRLHADARVRGRGAEEAVFYRTAQAIEDQSIFFAGRIGHSTRLGEGRNVQYGLDIRNTVPITDGTVTGVYEDSDDILVAGGYVNSFTRISSWLDVATVLQIESHSRVDGLNVSPAVTLIFRPVTGHSLFASAARVAFMPSADNLFLDLRAGGMTAARASSTSPNRSAYLLLVRRLRPRWPGAGYRRTAIGSSSPRAPAKRTHCSSNSCVIRATRYWCHVRATRCSSISRAWRGSLPRRTRWSTTVGGG